VLGKPDVAVRTFSDTGRNGIAGGSVKEPKGSSHRVEAPDLAIARIGEPQIAIRPRCDLLRQFHLGIVKELDRPSRQAEAADLTDAIGEPDVAIGAGGDPVGS